ncbi:MAG: hypothetical protein IT323_07860 [Anaerolineae bacterium]|nr:hypothetical protein [Anaerolineae bacterium]
MIPEKLIHGLNNPNPAARIEMLRMLAMLEETAALPTLRSLSERESDPAVRETIRWTGGIIAAAAARGHSTDLGVRQHFRLDWGPSPDELEERAKLKKLHEQMELDRIRQQQDEVGSKVAGTAAWGAAAAMMGGLGVAASVMLSSLTGSGESGEKPEIGLAIDPQRPTDNDITAWANRLRHPDSRTRRSAAVELRTLNNLAALAPLAHRFALEPVPEVRQEIQASGKALYYNWIRWEQVQAEERAQTKPEPTTGPSAAEIFARAQAAREKKKR